MPRRFAAGYCLVIMRIQAIALYFLIRKSLSYARWSMNFWTGLILGIIIGWLVEWIIDWLFWRRDMGAAPD